MKMQDIQNRSQQKQKGNGNYGSGRNKTAGIIWATNDTRPRKILQIYRKNIRMDFPKNEKIE